MRSQTGRRGGKKGVGAFLGAAIVIGVGLAQAPPERHSIRTLLDTGQYERAEAEARKAHAAAADSDSLASEQRDALATLLVEAIVVNGRAGQPDALSLARDNVRRHEQRLGESNPLIVPALLGLADVLLEQAEFPAASDVAARAVRLCEQAFGPDSLPTASALDRLGDASSGGGRHGEALSILQRSLGVKEGTPAAGGSAIAGTLERIAWALQRQGDYDQSGRLLRRAVSLRETGARHPALAKTLGLLADQLWFEGDLPASKLAAERAVAIAEAALRPEHPILASLLRDLASTLGDLGDVDGSLALKRRALAIAEADLGPSHHVTAEYLNGLGLAELRGGNYPSARRHLREAVAIFERRYGRTHEYVATSLSVLALIDARMGDHAASQRALARAVEIHTRVGGPNHPFVALALTELAAVYVEEGRPAEARPLLERALAIRQSSLGANHRDVARTLADLASTLAALGQLARAQQLATRALGIWEGLDAPDAPEFAGVLALYADLQARRGDIAAARDYYTRALGIRGKVFGVSNPVYAEGQIGLATALARLGDPLALPTALDAERKGREHLRLMLRSLPERQALQYAAARPRGLHLVLSLASTSPDAARSAVDELIRGRALVLDEVAARAGVGHAAGDDAGSLRQAMAVAQQRLANLLVRGQGAMSADQYAGLIDAARQEGEAAEQALAERSATYRADRSRAQIGTDDVVAALPDDAALVSFARYARTALPGPSAVAAAGRPPAPAAAAYLAIVLRRGRPPAVVPLGSALGLDALVAQWRRDIAAAPSSAASDAEAVPVARVSGAALRRRVWDPLAPHLAEARQVFVVPDGSLGLVPFAALPVGQRSYLLERGPVVHYLSAERDLVAPPRVAAAPGGLLALGGASFDDRTLFETRPGIPTPMPEAAATDSLRGTLLPCSDLRAIRFQPLGGTRSEVRDLSATWPAAAGHAQVLVGRDASETAFKRAAPGRRVLHLATHGFFLDGDCAPAEAGTRGVGGLTAALRSRPAENPLRLSGLALAGANRRALAGPEDDDGILTAEEVAALDLEGVEWAVLSACDTGVGEVRAGEGVFGLRRAFQVAGARTVIMSLWSVDDHATRAWMRALYEGRLQRQLSTADAVHHASLSMLRERRARGLSTEPFYWAAFVAAGDWR